MFYVVVGCFGFLVIHLFDIIAMQKWRFLKPVTWVTGNALLLFSLGKLSLQSNRLAMPTWSTWLGWTLFVISSSLLIYSLFVNLPFRKTYVSTGIGDQLVTNGLYALVRHPGVHWFSLALLALALVSKSAALLAAVPLFIFLDIVLVVIQDKFFFTRMFRGYARYQQETPMLIPNRQSIKTFINSL